MKIRTASDQGAVRQRGGYRRFVLACAKARWPQVAALNWTARGSVAAYVLRSNWVVKCPTCPEVLMAEPGEPFVCPNCLNAANSGQAYRVIWPKDRAVIEGLLLKRPDPGTRNWLHGETAAMLRAENAAHGIKESD